MEPNSSARRPVTANPVPQLHAAGKNHLLELLSQTDRDRLLSSMERLAVEQGHPVFDRRQPITHVHFPLSAMVSLVTIMEDGSTAEVGTIGNEGLAGLALLFGGREDANTAFYQIPGETLVMPAENFEQELSRCSPFRQIVHRYAQAFYTQVAQSTACNRLHPVEQRLARWILMSQDRAGNQTIQLTQEFIAQMLGVRRATVSVVAGTLQQAGLIRYRRGVIEVLDRNGVEEASCECYARVRSEFERLLC